jgi:flavin reductase (DIM6/NTAB) family NADH-FMN oxidoreductase RutF
MISGIIPRPIGFVSTVSADGKSTNLAPFSYTQMVNHDPPVIVIGFSGGSAQPKNTLKNILETKECTVNMINEHMVEYNHLFKSLADNRAANFCSIDAPHGVSEWALSGLTPLPSRKVKPSRVGESMFTIECKLMNHQEFHNSYGENTGAMVVLEGVWFHVREDAFTNEDQNVLREEVLKPISRLGGITYGRVIHGFEIPRPIYKQYPIPCIFYLTCSLKDEDQQHVKPKVNGQ